MCKNVPRTDENNGWVYHKKELHISPSRQSAKTAWNSIYQQSDSRAKMSSIHLYLRGGYWLCRINKGCLHVRGYGNAKNMHQMVFPVGKHPSRAQLHHLIWDREIFASKHLLSTLDLLSFTLRDTRCFWRQVTRGSHATSGERFQLRLDANGSDNYALLALPTFACTIHTYMLTRALYIQRGTLEKQVSTFHVPSSPPMPNARLVGMYFTSVHVSSLLLSNYIRSK